jgi:hypothetical protein
MRFLVEKSRQKSQVAPPKAPVDRKVELLEELRAYRQEHFCLKDGVICISASELNPPRQIDTTWCAYLRHFDKLRTRKSAILEEWSRLTLEARRDATKN